MTVTCCGIRLWRLISPIRGQAALGLLGLLVLSTGACRKQPSASRVSEADIPADVGPKMQEDGLMSWIDGTTEVTDWAAEKQIREKFAKDYLHYDGPRNAELGFREGQSPRLAWKWFEEAPVGFVGVPYVVLKTILNLDASFCTDEAKVKKYSLCPIYKIWHKTGPDGVEGTVDHIGTGPHPDNYETYGSRPSAVWPLPYGLTIQGGTPIGRDDKADLDITPFEQDIDVWNGSAYAELRGKQAQSEKGLILQAFMKSQQIPIPATPAEMGQAFAKYGPIFAGLPKETRHAITGGAMKAGIAAIDARLQALIGGLLGNTANPEDNPLHISDVAESFKDEEPALTGDRPAHEAIYANNYKTFGRPNGLDGVFFACAACHVSRVNVNGKIEYNPGGPNTEIQGQYFSQLIMETGAALSLNFNTLTPTLLVPRGQIVPNPAPALGLAIALIETAKSDEALKGLYGPSPAQILRGRMMIFRVISNITMVLKDLIGSAVKTHFVYGVMAAQKAYSEQSLTARGLLKPGQKVPDLFGHRIGRMDAFGIASGLVAIHAIRPDNSCLKFIYHGQDIYGSGAAHEAFGGFAYFGKNSDIGRGPDQSLGEEQKIAQMKGIIFNNAMEWQPPVPGAVDLKSLFMGKYRALANWDGNQGASARTLASGTSATGDPRQVNTEIHEPQNAFMDNLPSRPYPFAINLEKAKKGRALYAAKCAKCHSANNREIYSEIGVDPNRALVNTSVSRTLLAGLVLESCDIYAHNREGKPGAKFCLPKGADPKDRLKDFFEDTPGRVANLAGVDPSRSEGKKAGYKADMLWGVWAQAPYLHNGSIPTLGHLLCSAARPAKFIRGNINYDQALVGYDWADKGQRSAPGDLYNVEEYDTSILSMSNAGHQFSDDICPKLDGLDPIADRKEVETRISNSEAGNLVEYMKTL